MANGKFTRRRALKMIGAGMLAGGVAYGLSRSEVIDFLDKDAKDGNPIKVTRRNHRGQDRPLLGFGCMRFPVIDRDYSKIDEELSIKMIDYGIRHGVNHFDTAYPYHRGQSEIFVGKVLQRYPRESYYLADKMPGWMVDSLSRAKDIFNEQLDKCKTKYFDNYFLHALSDTGAIRPRTTNFAKIYEEMGVLNYLKEQKQAGRIKHLGFSYHGDVPFFDYLLKNYDWDMVMIDLNYLDWSHEDEERFKHIPAATNGRYAGIFYKRIEALGMPCYVMEPVRGGQLAVLNPAAVKIFKKANPNRSTASWAMRYVGSLPAVTCVLSGMSKLEHLIDNINTMSNFEPLTKGELAVIDDALEAFLSHETIFCTSCRYCMPCPYGVDIPGVFQTFNECSGNLGIPDIKNPAPNIDEQSRAFLIKYNNSVERISQADHCIGCGKCKPLCPQRLDIPAHMRRIDNMVMAIDLIRGGII